MPTHRHSIQVQKTTDKVSKELGFDLKDWAGWQAEEIWALPARERNACFRALSVRADTLNCQAHDKLERIKRLKHHPSQNTPEHIEALFSQRKDLALEALEMEEFLIRLKMGL